MKDHENSRCSTSGGIFPVLVLDVNEIINQRQAVHGGTLALLPLAPINGIST